MTLRRLVFLALLLTASVATMAQTTTVILVRHAEKEAEGDDPSLTTAGRQRAEALARTLQDVEVSAIYTTPYRRTRQTVSPLAERKDLPVLEYNPLDMEAFLSLVHQVSGKTLVFAGHSNTVPAMANALLGTKKYNDLEEGDYDRLYIIILQAGSARCLLLHYGAPGPE